MRAQYVVLKGFISDMFQAEYIFIHYCILAAIQKHLSQRRPPADGSVPVYNTLLERDEADIGDRAYAALSI